jgi:hypothetical protein
LVLPPYKGGRGISPYPFDDVRVYNYALTATQEKDGFDHGGDLASLIGLVRLKDGTPSNMHNTRVNCSEAVVGLWY